MSRFRQFAPSEFDGQKAPFKLLSERKKLIGKRVGYDTKWSSFAQYGRVTGAYGRELEVDGSAVAIGGIEQLCILKNQESP